MIGCQDSHITWHHRLPTDLHPTHLKGRFVPEGVVKFGDITASLGTVVVELRPDHEELGFVNQLVEANASSFNMDEKLRILVVELEAKMKVNMDVDIDARVEAKIQANIEGQVDTLVRKREEARDRGLEDRVRALEDRDAFWQQRNRDLSAEVEHLKKESVLSNKVDKRVILTLAREAVERVIGRPNTSRNREFYDCISSRIGQI